MRLILITIISILSCSCSSDTSQEQEHNHHTATENKLILSPVQIKNAGIESGFVKKHVLNDIMRVNGIVEVPPQNIVSISFSLGGYLVNTHLLPGLQVRKGEVIARIEHESLIQLQQDFLMAKSKMDLLQKNLERQRTLNKHQVSADKIFQQAEQDFQSQKILLKGYEEKLRLIKINPDKLTAENISGTVPVYSPIDGFVSKVNINIGKFVNPSDVLFELINPDDIHATLTVFENDLGKIKTGQKVMVTFVDDPSMAYACEVLLVSRNVDEDRSALVHCHFEDKPKRLLPGMFLNAVIEVSSSDVLAVPEASIVRYDGQDFIVEVEQDSIFHLRPVTTGIKDDSLVEISSKTIELEGKAIITKNPYPVLSGMKNTEEEH